MALRSEPACARTNVTVESVPHRQPDQRNQDAITHAESGGSPLVRWLYQSSLHVRGADQAHDSCNRPSLVIPACAGNSVEALSGFARAAGHSCVCGEQRSAAMSVSLGSGSSLRVQGTDRVRHAHGGGMRVIPACAGNSSASPAPVVGIPCHPCVCGEQCGWAKVHQRGSGSSLRVRGTVADNPSCHDLRRVILACAGNMPSARISKSLRKGHPCVCGEQPVMGRDALVGLGSSLRVRGTDRIERVLRQQPRVIPACAGNRNRQRIHRRVRPGHPCVCGDRAASISTRRHAPGHPCVCGEQIVFGEDGRMERGSSLRVRGTDSVRWCATERSCQIQTP